MYNFAINCEDIFQMKIMTTFSSNPDSQNISWLFEQFRIPQPLVQPFILSWSLWWCWSRYYWPFDLLIFWSWFQYSDLFRCGYSEHAHPIFVALGLSRIPVHHVFRTCHDDLLQLSSQYWSNVICTVYPEVVALAPKPFLKMDLGRVIEQQQGWFNLSWWHTRRWCWWW